MKNREIIENFVASIFYIGKGCKMRSNDHLVETFKKNAKKSKMSEKEEKINEILDSTLPTKNGKYGLGKIFLKNYVKVKKCF